MLKICLLKLIFNSKINNAHLQLIFYVADTTLDVNNMTKNLKKGNAKGNKDQGKITSGKFAIIYKKFCIMQYNFHHSKSNNAFGLTVKPTIKMDGDSTPELLLSDDEESMAPVGDIADLTARVSENAATPGKEANEPSSARVKVFTSQKNKGVGKGSSGSSGPPLPRCGKVFQQQFLDHLQKKAHLKKRNLKMRKNPTLVRLRPSR